MSEHDYPHQPSQCIELLSAAPLKLQYLAEGNANVIFKVRPTTPELTTHNNCCVLRLRKNLPFTKPAIEVLTAFRTRIMPLYEDHQELLLEQALYKLNADVLGQADSIIRLLERDEKPNRAPKRRKVYLPSLEAEPHGILMPNLHRRPNVKLLEFKPKWLLQSPSAPLDAKRCRTCALNALRRAEGKVPGRGDGGFCPLSLLLSEKIDEVLTSIAAPISAAALTPDFVSKVRPALFHHRHLQQKHDEVGLQDFRDPTGKDFSVAMALRDCSVFLVVEASGIGWRIVEVKFADLDLKTPDGGKLEHWASIEKSLLDYGAYVAEDQICVISSPVKDEPDVK